MARGWDNVPLDKKLEALLNDVNKALDVAEACAEKQRFMEHQIAELQDRTRSLAETVERMRRAR